MKAVDPRNKEWTHVLVKSFSLERQFVATKSLLEYLEQSEAQHSELEFDPTIVWFAVLSRTCERQGRSSTAPDDVFFLFLGFHAIFSPRYQLFEYQGQ